MNTKFRKTFLELEKHFSLLFLHLPCLTTVKPQKYDSKATARFVSMYLI